MMKPNFDDVVEFVKAGEDDPRMENMLRHHPDGPELLKQARFICKMLQLKSESTDDDLLAAGPGKPPADEPGVGESAVYAARDEARDSRTFYQGAPPRRRGRPPRKARGKFDATVEELEELGTLTFAAEGKRVTLSYSPSKAVTQRYGQPYLVKYLMAQGDIEGIQMRGSKMTLSLPESLPVSDPMTIRVARNLKNNPVENLKLVFMPESGPFVLLETDSAGNAELPVPDSAGVLRIESATPQLLHIKPKK